MSYRVTDKGDRKLGCGLLSYRKRTLFMLVFCFTLSACSQAPDDATIRRAILESDLSVCGMFSSAQVHSVEVLQKGQFNEQFRSLQVRAIVKGECIPQVALNNIPVKKGPFNRTVEVTVRKNDFGEWKAY